MWTYEKRLQFPVNIGRTCPKTARLIISQYGGPDGELSASLRYLSQRYTMPVKTVGGLLTDIGTEELAQFIKMEYGRIGADQNITPREVIRDFIELLDLLYQNPSMKLEELLQSDDFTFAKSEAVSDQTDKNYMEFTL